MWAHAHMLVCKNTDVRSFYDAIGFEVCVDDPKFDHWIMERRMWDTTV